MTPGEHLRKARAILEDPTRWTQGSFARDKEGIPTSMTDPETAVSWCAMGAMYVDGEIYGRLQAFRFLSDAIPVATVPRSDLTRYNDMLTDHKDLLAWFDRAIALAEAP